MSDMKISPWLLREATTVLGRGFGSVDGAAAGRGRLLDGPPGIYPGLPSHLVQQEQRFQRGYAMSLLTGSAFPQREAQVCFIQGDDQPGPEDPLFDVINEKVSLLPVKWGNDDILSVDRSLEEIARLTVLYAKIQTAALDLQLKASLFMFGPTIGQRHPLIGVDLIGRPWALLLEPELERGNDVLFSALMAETEDLDRILAVVLLARLLRSKSPQVRDKAVGAVRAFDALSPYQDMLIDLVTPDREAFDRAYRMYYGGSLKRDGTMRPDLRLLARHKNFRLFMITSHYVAIQIKFFEQAG